MPHLTTRGPRASRAARTTAVLRPAVLDAVAKGGYAAVTIEGVAVATGVAKTTIYRRWRSKAEMVFDVVLAASPDLPVVADTGSLAADLRSLVERVTALVCEEPGRTVLPGIIADMAGDPVLAERFRSAVVTGARSVIAAPLVRAVERGEIPDARAAAHVQAALLGTLFAWTHILPDPLPADLTDRLVAQLLALVDVAECGPESQGSTP